MNRGLLKLSVPRPVYLRWLAATVLGTALVILILVWLAVKNAELGFSRQAADYYDLVSQRMNSNDAVLGGLVAMNYAVEEMEYDQLSLYAREMLADYPHISSIEYLVRVDRKDLSEFEAGMREQGFVTFRVRELTTKNPHWQPVGNRPFYYPVVFVEPFDPVDVQELGHDFYSNPVLRDAISKAIDSGNAVASAPVKLPRGTDGYFLFRAVYAGRDVPSGLEDRRRQARRIVAVTVSANDILSVAQPGALQMDVHVYHSAYPKDGIEGRFFSRQTSDRQHGFFLFPTFRFEKQIESAGQPFVLVLERKPDLGIIPWHVLAFVFSVCLLISALVLYIINNRYSSAEVRQMAREAIYRERERAEVTLYAIADGVVTTDVNGIVEYLNPVAERLTGWRAREARGKSVNQVFGLMDESSGKKLENPISRCAREGVTINLGGELSLFNRNGRKFAINESVAPIRDYNGTIIGTVLVFQDVGKAREMSRLLAYQATHDDLTALIGRREFEKRVSHAIETAHNENRSHVLCYLDLDRFKVVNDTCGHIAGDSLLKQIASLLKPHVRESDTLARLGGDEFGILLENCALDVAMSAAEKLIDAVKSFHFAWEGKTFEVAVSIGMVHITEEYLSLTEVMSFADSACYLAKENGGNRIHVYQADDDALLKRQGEMQWVHRIAHAYSENRFRLYAQEIVPLHEQVVHEKRYEILLRMLDESGNLVLPMEYITAAERYNMMADLDRWVISNAFSLINDYAGKRRGESDLPVKHFAINLSGQSLSDERTLAFVQEQFSVYPELPRSIIFEITETAAVSNLAQASSFISLLREMGCRFALDDFGSGFSSFSYLKNLAVDYLKIDGAFVADMGYDPVNFAMVGSINHIGHVIGIKTIAEYVESDDVMEKLKDIGVDYGQGNWLSEPRPLEELVT